MNTTATAAARPARRRLASLALAASLVALPAGVGAVAFAGAASAAPVQTSAVTTSAYGTHSSTDALGGHHGDGFGADGSYDPHAHLVWWAAGERFTEKHHDSCNPYTFIFGGVQSDPHCPVGQVKSDWNVDFVKDAQQQAGFRTYTIQNDDLTTFQDEGVYTPYFHHADHPGDDYVPAGGDSIFWTDASGEHGTVGVVLEAKSATKVKVVIGDFHDKITTKWVNPATFTVQGHHVTGYVTPTYNG